MPTTVGRCLASATSPFRLLLGLRFWECLMKPSLSIFDTFSCPLWVYGDHANNGCGKKNAGKQVRLHQCPGSKKRRQEKVSFVSCFTPRKCRKNEHTFDFDSVKSFSLHFASEFRCSSNPSSFVLLPSIEVLRALTA